METPFQPHDRYFKALLSKPESAGTLVRERLPKEMVERLSPEPPELLDGTFIDGEFRHHLSDRLFRMRTIDGAAVHLYLLVEHKSRPDEWAAFQLLRYMVRIMERMRREAGAGERLSPILPLLIHHGREPWRTPARFSALVDAEESWRPFLLDFPYFVVDLGTIDDRKLSREDRLRGGLLALKYVFRWNPKAQLAIRIARDLKSDPEFAIMTLRYLASACKEMDMKDIFAYSKEMFPGDADQYASRFAREMIAKGKQEGESALLLRQLRSRHGELPDWVADKIDRADSATLETWSLRFVHAQSLEEVFKP